MQQPAGLLGLIPHNCATCIYGLTCGGSSFCCKHHEKNRAGICENWMEDRTLTEKARTAAREAQAEARKEELRKKYLALLSLEEQPRYPCPQCKQTRKSSCLRCNAWKRWYCSRQYWINLWAELIMKPEI